jgi:tRNA(Ile)-lysidine synthase
MSFVARVRRTLSERRLVEPGMRVLVACSGGPDSAALLYVLSELAPELGLQLEAASVNHGLRADAEADVEAARAQAAHVGVPFHALRVDVSPEGSVQAAAREARYAALLELARRSGAQRVASGHTRDDQAETVLLRLLRGSGLRGLSAIEPLRADGVMRPLMDATRDETHAFARSRSPAIAADRSNDDLRFERTRVRNTLLPSLRVEDAAVDVHLARLADESQALFDFLDLAARQALVEVRHDDDSLRISALRALPLAVGQAVLRIFLRQMAGSTSRDHLRQVTEACLSGRGEVWLSAEYAAIALSSGLLTVRRRTDRDPDARP